MEAARLNVVQSGPEGSIYQAIKPSRRQTDGRCSACRFTETRRGRILISAPWSPRRISLAGHSHPVDSRRQTDTHSHRHKHTCAHTHSQTQAHILADTHLETHTHTHSQTLTHTHTHSRRHMHTHTHAETHTHTLADRHT